MTADNDNMELSETEFRTALSLASRFREEADACLGAKAYIAATAMLGAALEAVLMTRASIGPGELPREKTLAWGLSHFIKHGHSKGWITDAQMHDIDEAILQPRNVAAHPGRWIRENRTDGEFDGESLERAWSTIDQTIDALMDGLREEFGHWFPDGL